MTDALTRRHGAALALAREAGALARDHFRHRDRLVVEAKSGPQDVVSAADRAVEALLRARLSALFPDDAILGEEEGLRPGRSGLTWVIDPIDGTMPFLSGLPDWCVAIALVDDERTLAAATFAPAAGELYAARRGGGASLDGRPLRIDPALGLRGRMTALGANDRADPAHVAEVIAALMRAGGIFYRTGAGALMLARVAAGRLAGYYEPHMHAWDCLGGLLMIEEAGGRTRPVAMPDMLARGGQVLAAAPAAWDDLRRIAEGAG
jgi:myo-inositol-1(or 4)-monophosphatase